MNFANDYEKEVSKASDHLITVYSSDLDIKRNKSILKEIKKSFPQAKIVGATTAGEIDGKKVKKEEVLITLHVFKNTSSSSVEPVDLT